MVKIIKKNSNQAKRSTCSDALTTSVYVKNEKWDR